MLLPNFYRSYKTLLLIYRANKERKETDKERSLGTWTQKQFWQNACTSYVQPVRQNLRRCIYHYSKALLILSTSILFRITSTNKICRHVSKCM